MKITTRIRVTLDIEAEGTWSDNCPISQVKSQSIEDANMKLGKALKDHNIKTVGKSECVTVILNDN